MENATVLPGPNCATKNDVEKILAGLRSIERILKRKEEHAKCKKLRKQQKEVSDFT